MRAAAPGGVNNRRQQAFTRATQSLPKGTDMSDTTTAKAANGKTALTDDLRTHFAGDKPIVDKAKGFAKARPWTSAAFLGVAAIAVLNTLRGKQPS